MSSMLGDLVIQLCWLHLLPLSNLMLSCLFFLSRRSWQWYTSSLVSAYSTQPSQTKPLGVVDSLTLVRPLSRERGDVSGARVFMGGYSTCRGCCYQFLLHIWRRCLIAARPASPVFHILYPILEEMVSVNKQDVEHTSERLLQRSGAGAN